MNNTMYAVYIPGLDKYAKFRSYCVVSPVDEPYKASFK